MTKISYDLQTGYDRRIIPSITNQRRQSQFRALVHAVTTQQTILPTYQVNPTSWRRQRLRWAN